MNLKERFASARLLNKDGRNSILLLVALLIASSGVMIHYSLEARQEKEQLENSVIIVEAPKQTAFDQINLSAQAAYVWDIKNQQELFAMNGDRELALASLTKIMTVATAAELLPESTNITIEPEFLTADGDSGLVPYETWRLSDLIDFSLLVSSNDGVKAIASVAGADAYKTATFEEGRQAFIKQMNVRAEELGLNHTHFTNESGLDNSKTNGGAYGSARDMARLFEYTYTKYPPLFEMTRYEQWDFRSLSGFNHQAKNTNTLIGQMAGVLASKTGYTELAGGNLAVIFDPELGRPIVIVVLGSTQNARLSDVEKLIGATMKQITSEN